MLQHKLELCSHGNGDIMATMTVSVIFRPVDMLCHLVIPSVVEIVEDNLSLSSYESRGLVMKKVWFNWNILLLLLYYGLINIFFNCN